MTQKRNDKKIFSERGGQGFRIGHANKYTKKEQKTIKQQNVASQIKTVNKFEGPLYFILMEDKNIRLLKIFAKTKYKILGNIEKYQSYNRLIIASMAMGRCPVFT